MLLTSTSIMRPNHRNLAEFCVGYWRSLDHASTQGPGSVRPASHRDAQFKALQEALVKRTGRSGGLILTSSRSPLRSSIEDRPYLVVPISDVLTNDAISPSIVRSLCLRMFRRSKGGDVTAPIYLSPDGRRSSSTAGSRWISRVIVHIAIIRRLVDGHQEERDVGQANFSTKPGRA